MNGQGRWSESSMPFDRLEEMFGEWMRTRPANRRPGRSFWAEATRADAPPRDDRVDGDARTDARTDDGIAVDEYREDGAHVFRAALPGIDPDQDVELSADDGVLRIAVERRSAEADGRSYVRRELRRGRSSRSLPLPERATPGDIRATYRDGILEIRIPLAEPPVSEPTRISVTRD